MKSLASLVLLLTTVCANPAAAVAPAVFKDIVGEYYFGDGKGVSCNLIVTEKSRFTFRWHGCLGTYDSNEGAASVNEGFLHLAPEKPNIRKGFSGTPTVFYPVRWGARMYLIATNEIVEFCSAFIQGREPRSVSRGNYYLRLDDEYKPATGKPSVPKEWEAYLLDRPVHGKIIQLIGKQEAWLDKGSDDGLLVGMILTARQQGKLMFAQVQITAVEKARCRIKCRWDGDELALEQVVSTRFHD